MERAKWLLLMNVKCKLQAMGWGFYHGNIASPVSGGFVPKLLHFNRHPRDVGRSYLSRSPSVVSGARINRIIMGGTLLRRAFDTTT
jgi:hypothetical protein